MRHVIPGTLKFKHFSLAAMNYKLYSFGGREGTANSPTSNVYMMDIVTKVWSISRKYHARISVYS